RGGWVGRRGGGGGAGGGGGGGGLRGSGGSEPQSRIRGATTRAPPASPSHQVSQTVPYADQGTFPPSARLVTPRVALTMVAPPAARSVYRKISRACSSERLPRP